MPITINGSGTVTGISAGGLPDGVITPADLSQPLTLGTAQASTSGTFIDFTGIPSWVKRVTVLLNQVSTNGTSPLLIQVGSGSVLTSGYASSTANVDGTNATSVNTISTGFRVVGASTMAAAGTISGHVSLVKISGNIWTVTSIAHRESGLGSFSSGVVDAAGVVDRVRMTTINGTDTFDAGSINILYE